MGGEPRRSSRRVAALALVAIAVALAGVALWLARAGGAENAGVEPGLDGPLGPAVTDGGLDGSADGGATPVDSASDPADAERATAPTPVGAPGDGRLRVRVVGEDGAPRAGVTVRLWTPTASDDPVHEVATDTRGEARLPLADLHPTLRCEVDLDAVLAGRGVVPVGFPVTAPPADGVEFVLPDTGALEVTVLGEDGEPWSGDVLADTWVRPRDGEVRREDHPTRLSGVHGVLRWDAVALGRELALVLEVGHARVAVADLEGPRVAGEVARYRLLVADHLALLHLRVLGLDGAPLRDAPLWVHARHDLGGGRVVRPTWKTRTDPEGRVVVPVGTASEDPHLVGLEVADATNLGDEPPEAWPRADVPLPATRTPGVHRAGDVRLRDPADDPLLVRGVVRDPTGAPVHFATVRLVRPGESWPAPGGEGHDGRTDTDGTYALRGRWPGPPVELHVSDREHVSQRLAVAEGQTVDVRLSYPARLRGEVLLDPGLPATRLWMEARPTGAPRDSRPQRTRVDADGTFRLERAAPGDHDLSVRLDGADRVLWSRDAVPLVATDPGGAPTLEPIDLRGTLRVQRVWVESADDDPVRHGRVRLLDGPADDVLAPGSDGPWASFWGGRFELLVPRGPVDLGLRVEGHVPLRLEGLTEDHRVTLPAPVSCTLRLVPDGPLPEGALELFPFLETAGPWADTVWEPDVPWRATQEYALDGLAPGPLRLGLRVTRRVGTDSYSRVHAAPDGPALDLRPEQAGTVVELRVPAEAIQAALRGE